MKGAKNLAAETARELESFETYKPVCRRYEPPRLFRRLVSLSQEAAVWLQDEVWE